MKHICSQCGLPGHNKRTCTEAEKETVCAPLVQLPRPAIVPADFYDNEKQITEQLLLEPSFWTWKQRQAISEEITAYRKSSPDSFLISWGFWGYEERQIAARELLTFRNTGAAVSAL